MENPIKMDDLGVPLFLETPKQSPSEKTVPIPLSTPSLGDGTFEVWISCTWVSSFHMVSSRWCFLSRSLLNLAVGS